ncbi:MAG TPA: ATP-binding protein [Terriglobales bacterium]|nr:ATP-binding protein [Terriglobales bacterium]
MKRRSLTRQLIASVVVTQLVLTGAVVGLAMYLTRWQLRRSFDEQLHGRAVALAALVRYSEDEKPVLQFDSTMAPPPLDTASPDQFQIVGPGGKILGQSAGWTNLQPRQGGAQYATVSVGDRHYRVVELRNVPVLDQESPGTTSADTLTVSYAATDEQIRRRAAEIALQTMLGSFGLLVIAVAVAAWTVRRRLAPLAELAESARQVTPQHWQLDAPEMARATSELVPLTQSMDRMLATLQKAFTSQREFVSNAAHELKTPIAVLKSTLQLALQRPREAEEYRLQVLEALDDVERLEALAHSLLRLARAEQIQELKRTELPIVDIAANCEQSAERWRTIAGAKSVRIEVNTTEKAEVRGDPDDLDLIWSNLLDNAIRYSPADSEVMIAVSRDNDIVRVEVRDQGSGIERGQLQNIFERFQRTDASRSRETGGYGLGLAIAKAMTEAYGGSIAAESQPGEGTMFSVRLPATNDPSASLKV